jgi:hypothetical protein
LGALLWSGGCTEDPEAPRPDTEEAELESGRVGHVHVIVQPRQDELDASPALLVEARFAEYRGLDEQSARVRANVPRDPLVGLMVGQCLPSDQLTDWGETEVEEDRELTLVDGGDLRVRIGSRDVVVPLALVPDLLPWVSGVEYVHAGDDLPLANAPDGTIPVNLQLEGSPDDELNGFELSIELPRRFELLPAVEAPTLTDEGALHLRWEPPGGAADMLVLELTAHGELAPVGGEVTCLVPDSGSARIDMGTLHAAGLAQADLIQVAARRISRAQVSAGAFTDIDVMVELRDQQLIPSP